MPEEQSYKNSKELDIARANREKKIEKNKQQKIGFKKATRNAFAAKKVKGKIIKQCAASDSSNSKISNLSSTTMLKENSLMMKTGEIDFQL